MTKQSVKRCAVAFLLIVGLLTTNIAAMPVSSDWFIPELSEIAKVGLLPQPFLETDLTATVTRAEVCAMLVSFWKSILGWLPDLPAMSPFTDASDRNVMHCYELGLISGHGDGTFAPTEMLSRQQMFCILYQLCVKLDMDVSEGGIALDAFPDCEQLADWASTAAKALLAQGIVTGSDGLIQPERVLTREQALAMIWRLWQRAVDIDAWLEIPRDVQIPVLPVEPEQEGLPDTDLDMAQNDVSLGSASESYEEKYIRIFGSVDAPKYQTAEEAEAHMVTITVPVWNYNTEHIKVQTSRTFLVHEAIADTVMAIFTEIFNGPEQFPIYSVGGYSWRGDGTSEHNWGIAIDINPDENYYVYHGVPTVGSYWKPGEDPYSIPEDGDVVRAFAKYGFAWGGNAWRYTQDYMHFSYFGE